ncbi:MAG: 2-C-methyl-D-erythritol 4-phosphate cytidylyltransferase [Erysipelotrichaceae bacterium]|jgi:2-C-methyl-D-erythritol 4-phosphate cytidylyltransferase|nr:2-C-methyl-D-erythritol 4-phosphate cytidylyltransferase [Bacillota bacterium]MDY0118343.1 2-C-methyl-D-erythritol 4-phosphate cytidylyltransferase [Bacilli bacterium]NLJ32224.1 2-C-methyl-D-erythritol 4-phosphate cytidylyltransferase [Erysipelotrichaceae bacterium]HOF65465.1 2-C-methyl-D-erythritol 4-phosphate cytidylyltransferase [Bacilli bacterium]
MNYAVILMAGKGERFGGPLPKQFLNIGNKPLYLYTVETFAFHQDIDAILIVCEEMYKNRIQKDIVKFKIPKITTFITGGTTRQSSAFNALIYLNAVGKENDIVLIHDGDRPLVTSEIISNNIAAMQITDAAITAIPSANSLGISYDNQTISSFPPRQQYYVIQTPQTFKLGLIYKAHVQANQHINKMYYTDDGSIVLAYGKEVNIVRGSTHNFKITTYDDFTLLKTLLRFKNQ